MAVYTEFSDEELDALLKRYDIGQLQSVKGIAEGVENSNFLLVTDRAPYILTLYERRVDAADLPFFLGLMEHLAEHGVDCPLPVADRSGQRLGRLAERPAAIVTFLQGVSVRRPDTWHCGAVGAVLARMHLAAGDFAMRRANALSVPAWRPLFATSAERADEVQPGLAAEIAAELDFLERNWPAGLPEGVIHADLFPDNVFFLRQQISGVIDFYFACNDMMAYDATICLNAWCFEPDLSLNVTKARALLGGYAAVRPFTPEEIAALPVLARGAALRFLLTRLYDWLTVPEGSLVTPKQPTEYLKKLRFHRQVSGAGDYGIEV
jgi:homoserine kinase type II